MIFLSAHIFYGTTLCRTFPHPPAAAEECTALPTLNNGATLDETECQTAPVVGNPATVCTVICAAGTSTPATVTCSGAAWDVESVDCVGRLHVHT